VSINTQNHSKLTRNRSHIGRQSGVYFRSTRARDTSPSLSTCRGRVYAVLRQRNLNRKKSHAGAEEANGLTRISPGSLSSGWAHIICDWRSARTPTERLNLIWSIRKTENDRFSYAPKVTHFCHILCQKTR
jgi:hypothetical protein